VLSVTVIPIALIALRIRLHDCQNYALSLAFSDIEGAEVLDAFLKFRSTSAANRTWLTFVPLRRRKFNRDTAIMYYYVLFHCRCQ